MSAIRYGSVCSGIEAASVAWEPLGMEPSWFAEIEDFPSRVLAHRFPHVVNHGDFTKISDPGAIDVLVGGTPCQSFSIAGLRGGMADSRGNLALEFFRLAARARPRWIVWENVPGVLSSNAGRDFGAILGALVELGYGFAYRVLDAQFFGVPQRRRRVFVVGCAGDWRSAAAVLFERDSVPRDPPPRCSERRGVARGAGEGAANDRISGALTGGASEGAGHRIGPDELRSDQFAYQCHGGSVGPAGTLTTGSNETRGVPFIAHTLRGEGADASGYGTGGGTPLVVGTLNANGRSAGSMTQQDAEAGNYVLATASGGGSTRAHDELRHALRSRDGELCDRGFL